MFDIGFIEILIICFISLVILGPSRLPAFISSVEEIFLKLKNNKLVRSSRGANGGYVLEKPASEIKLSNIIYAVDEEVRTLNCKKNSKRGCNNKSTKCITHNLWDQLDQHIIGFFEKVKLQDLAKLG